MRATLADVLKPRRLVKFWLFYSFPLFSGLSRSAKSSPARKFFRGDPYICPSTAICTGWGRFRVNIPDKLRHNPPLEIELSGEQLAPHLLSFLAVDHRSMAGGHYRGRGGHAGASGDRGGHESATTKRRRQDADQTFSSRAVVAHSSSSDDDDNGRHGWMSAQARERGQLSRSGSQGAWSGFNVLDEHITPTSCCAARSNKRCSPRVCANRR